MSEEFKGVAGGDPSRRPALVTMSWMCEGCRQENIVETRHPKSFTAPRFCGKVCEKMYAQTKLRDIYQSTFGTALPNEEYDSGLCVSIVKYHEMLEMTKTGKKIHVATLLCPQCEQRKAHFTNVPIAKRIKSKFCSTACKRSSKVGLPVGSVCPRPLKKRFTTQSEARTAVMQTNDALTGNSEDEKMVEYHCTCGCWHFGHISKAVFEEQALNLREKIMSDLRAVATPRSNKKQKK